MSSWTEHYIYHTEFEADAFSLWLLSREVGGADSVTRKGRTLYFENKIVAAKCLEQWANRMSDRARVAELSRPTVVVQFTDLQRMAGMVDADGDPLPIDLDLFHNKYDVGVLAGSRTVWDSIGASMARDWNPEHLARLKDLLYLVDGYTKICVRPFKKGS